MAKSKRTRYDRMIFVHRFEPDEERVTEFFRMLLGLNEPAQLQPIDEERNAQIAAKRAMLHKEGR